MGRTITIRAPLAIDEDGRAAITWLSDAGDDYNARETATANRTNLGAQSSLVWFTLTVPVPEPVEIEAEAIEEAES